MLIRLEQTQITQQCTGTFSDGTPCTGVNIIPFVYLMLGQGDNPYLELGDQSGGVRIYAKKAGVSLALINTKSSAALSSALVSSTLTVTLADDGVDVETVYSELRAEIESKAGTSFACRTYGADNVVAPLALTALAYKAGTPRGIGKDTVLLPVCPVCASPEGQTVERLLRDFVPLAASVAATPYGRRKLATNFLATKLKQAHQVHYSFEAIIAAETSDPPSQLPGWPPGGWFLIDP